jgi:hypothetical protein
MIATPYPDPTAPSSPVDVDTLTINLRDNFRSQPDNPVDARQSRALPQHAAAPLKIHAVARAISGTVRNAYTRQRFTGLC